MENRLKQVIERGPTADETRTKVKYKDSGAVGTRNLVITRNNGIIMIGLTKKEIELLKMATDKEVSR